MDLYKDLELVPTRTEPLVWISRIVIFEKLVPEPSALRDIPLTRGLNIVWAEETEEDNPSAEISGHSAGKTTFCRLLRYVLGEKTFGTKANMDLIRRSLPEGYVAGEFYVAGKKWAVRRPFGGGRMSYVKQDVTVEELLEQRGESVSQDQYPEKVGLENLIDGLETGTVVRTGEQIQWGHVLAWSSRDQESRFQNIYDWRSQRSESESPTFRFSKAGPLFVMRAALGLFLPDELRGEEALAKLQQEKETSEKKLEERRREPQFRVNYYQNELCRHLKVQFPNEPDLHMLPLHSGNLLPDLHRLSESAESKIEDNLRTTQNEVFEIQSVLDGVGARIRQHEGDLAKLNTLFNLNVATSNELSAALSGREQERERLREYQDNLCVYGVVLIRDCFHVQERQGILQGTELQDSKAMEQAELKRRDQQRKIEWASAELKRNIEEMQHQRDGLAKKREFTYKTLEKDRQALRNLRDARDGVELWTQRRDQGLGYEEISTLREGLDTANREIERIEKELAGLLHQHDVNRDLLASIFSAAVKSVLSSGTYDGEVSLDDRELKFRITHGTAMTGEAVETLSVLLSDIACLVYNTVSSAAHLPGFVLHDSPREADLGLRIYRSFIRFVASLVPNETGTCPFQYILTTTTPPPEALQTDQYVKLRLNASHLDALLLRRSIAAPEAHAADLFGSEV